MQEKERYEMLVSLKQLKTKVSDQNQVIKTYQTKIQKFKQKQNTEEAKLILSEINGSDSFLEAPTATQSNSKGEDSPMIIIEPDEN